MIFAPQKKPSGPAESQGLAAEAAAGAPGREQLKQADYATASAMLAPAPAAQQGAQAAAAPKRYGPGDPRGLIGALHPLMQQKVRALLAEANARGLDVQVMEGYRSIARQNQLYAQGRTRPGARVTNARGGQSYHNFGVGVDIVFHGSAPWGEHHPWRKLGEAGEAVGLNWGGRWKNADRPHFQFPGVSLSQLQAWHARGGMENVWAQISKGAGEEVEEDRPGQAPSGSGQYTVRAGDTLTGIALAQLGNHDRWREIANLNGITNPGAIRPGQVLAMPGGGRQVNDADDDCCYVVEPGDTLGGIAHRALGNAERWREIATLNGIRDPKALRPGQKLKLPDKRASGGGAPARPVEVSYRVNAGDTLSGIALSFYGDASRWPEIARANGIASPSALRVGQTLKITNATQRG